MRARCEIVEGEKGAAEIVISEIPYQLSRETLVKRIAEAAKADRVEGIADVRNESDAKTRVVVKLRRGEDPEVVLNQLYRFTPLRESFSVILIALVDGRPVVCTLKRLLEEYIRHRKVVITRRTRFLLRKAEERDHLVAGLIKALDLIDAIVALIRASPDPQTAKGGLVERFAFTVVQAEAILQMRLQRLTGLERQELEDEHARLTAEIAEYRRILSDEKNVAALIRQDMEQLAERFKEPRKTSIEEAQGEIATLDLVVPENQVVTLSHQGYVKRTPMEEYRTQRRGGKGIRGTESKEGDFAEHLFVANTHDWLLFFTDRGRVHKERTHGLPVLGRYAQGRALVNFLELEEGERVCTVLHLRDLDDPRSILFATRDGRVKRTPLSDFQNIRRGGILAVQVRDGDALIGAALVDDSQEVVLVTALGKAIHCTLEDVRPMGRTASGVKGITLRGGDAVVGMGVVDPEATLLTFCARGYAKRSTFADYPVHSRGGLGVRNLSRSGLERNGPVVGARTVKDGDEIILITERGQVIRMRVTEEQFRTTGRDTGGVRAIEVPADDRLVSMAWVRPEEGAEGANGDGPDAGTAGGAADGE
jgi:DNA gyrase subunit A